MTRGAVLNVSGFRFPAWSDRAACAGLDTEDWFVEDKGSYREARQVCAICEVRVDCLNWAIETRTEHGLFGGKSPLERKRIARKRAS